MYVKLSDSTAQLFGSPTVGFYLFWGGHMHTLMHFKMNTRILCSSFQILI